MGDGAGRPGRDEPAGFEPRVVDRPSQPYAAIRGEVSMQTIPAIADRIPELIGLLAERGVAPAGAPFLRYVQIGPGDELVVDAGIAVDSLGVDEDPIEYGVLPGGRFVTVTHRGHFEELEHVTGELLDWADEQGLRFDVTYTDDAEQWGARLEFYNTNPMEEPDPANWETDLVFRLAD